MAATGFAQSPDARVRRVVYIDTLVPMAGQSWMDLLGPSVSTPLLDAASRFGDGWRVPRTDVHPPRWVPQPLASVTEPLPAARGPSEAAAVSYVFCTAKPAGWFFGLDSVIAEQAARAQQNGWDYHAIESDHLPMLSTPDRLANLLHAIALRADA